MNQEISSQIARRYFDDLWNRGNLAVIDSLIAPEIVGHVNASTFHGQEALKLRVGALWAAFSEPSFEVEDLIASGDRVAVRWRFRGRQTGPYLGRAATGRTVNVTGINWMRLQGERIAEIWVNADDLGELEQLGFIELPKS